jgi:hypothetical protein
VRKRSNKTWLKIDYGQLRIRIKNVRLTQVHFVILRFVRVANSGSPRCGQLSSPLLADLLQKSGAGQARDTINQYSTDAARPRRRGNRMNWHTL